MARNTRLRILQLGKFYPPVRGGMESHLETLCKELQDDADIKVLVANDGRQTTREIVDGVEVTRLGCLAQCASTSIIPRFAAHIRASRADVIHLHWPNPAAVVAYLQSRHPAKLVMTYHSDVVRQRVSAALFQPLLNTVLRRCETIIAGSPDYIRTSSILSRFSDRCRIIPFGIPDRCFQIPKCGTIESIRARYGTPLILGAGRLVYYKGFEYLIEALTKVPGHLVIAGDGPLRCELIALRDRLGLRDRVSFVSNLFDEELLNLYHAADVFVLPSVARSEAFGIVQLEAMAAGKPVINTDLPSGVPFVSLHGSTGLTVRPADARELARALCLLLENPGLRESFGRAAKKRVEMLFTSKTMGQSTLEAYQYAMSRSTEVVYA